MKVVATRSFSNGLDKSKSKLSGKRTKRLFIRDILQKGKQYDRKEDEVAEALHFGWVVPANTKEAEVVTKSVEKAEKAKADKTAKK